MSGPLGRMTTKADVEHAVSLVAKELHSEMQLSIWSPGDGWTRYQLINGPFSGRVWRGAELVMACQMALEAIRAERRRAAEESNS